MSARDDSVYYYYDTPESRFSTVLDTSHAIDCCKTGKSTWPHVFACWKRHRGAEGGGLACGGSLAGITPSCIKFLFVPCNA